MRILIFGAGGMIGHKMFTSLKAKGFEVFGTLKQDIKNYDQFQIFKKSEIVNRLDVLDSKYVTETLNQLLPDVILNCVGITLRKPEIKDEAYCTKVNAQFPHFLDEWCAKNKKYLIHFSTDCVFSGKDGPYTEDSPKSATDIYGRTKAAGEVQSAYSLTLRGSMIGRELFGKTELLEWAFSQKGQTIKGFSNAVYSGITTNLMADIVAKILSDKPPLTGLYQVSSQPISKYDLLILMNRVFDLNMTILEDKTLATSKVLISKKLQNKIGFVGPGWNEMLDQILKEN